ncbi:MAG: phosphate signaling complex protein PhoU [Defluviitaleaceae bacterium]|nr:phosphate signaling complex protein PhoU [Defluviitaleaceae bacterium]
MTIRVDYRKKLQAIFDKLVLMCRHAEDVCEKSVGAFAEKDLEIAREVKTIEKTIDKLERKIEKACLRLLVMEHPVASDFREVSATLKIIKDLERIGDQSKDIAKITIKLADTNIDIPENIRQMGVIIIQMIKDAVQAYINRDLQLALSIDETDDKADALFDIIMNDLVSIIQKNPQDAKQGLQLIMVAKYLERIGDHAVNIGEHTAFLIRGKV